MYTYLLTEVTEGIAKVTINREKALNALNPDRKSTRLNSSH